MTSANTWLFQGSGIRGTQALRRQVQSIELRALIMGISKPAKAIKVRVPRQNAQRLGPSLTTHLRLLGKKEGIDLQLLPPVQEQPGGAGASSVSSGLYLAAREVLMRILDRKMHRNGTRFFCQRGHKGVRSGMWARSSMFIS